MLKFALILLILFRVNVQVQLHVHDRDLTESAVALKGDLCAFRDHHLIYILTDGI